MREKQHPKKAAPLDWHPADIVAALRKSGWSLRRLSRHHQYADSTTLSTALARPWPKGERLIADAIGVEPKTIWPSRYTPDGRPVSGRAPKYSKGTTGRRLSNSQGAA